MDTGALSTRATVAAALLLAVAGMSGCSSSDNNGVATAGGGAAEQQSTAPSASVNADDQRLKLTQCLRDHGIDIPDQGANSTAVPDVDLGSDKFQSALKACQEFVPSSGGAGPGAMSEETQAQFLKLAACMRDEGLDFPDPKFDAEGRLQFDRGGLSINPSDPKVQKAFMTCSKKVDLQLPGAAGSN